MKLHLLLALVAIAVLGFAPNALAQDDAAAAAAALVQAEDDISNIDVQVAALQADRADKAATRDSHKATLEAGVSEEVPIRAFSVAQGESSLAVVVVFRSTGIEIHRVLLE